MGTIRTIGAVQATSAGPTPVYTGTKITAASFSITNNIATIVLGSAIPQDGYNGPNGFPAQNGTTGSAFDIHGGVAPGIQGGGQQVTLWGFTTATYFNGKTVTVLDNNPAANSFRFYFTHANVASTNDTGNTAAAPKEQYRAVRLEIGQAAGTDLIYVGDLNVTSSQYMTALSLSSNPSVTISSDNIRADRIMITTNGSVPANDTVQVTLIY